MLNRRANYNFYCKTICTFASANKNGGKSLKALVSSVEYPSERPCAIFAFPNSRNLFNSQHLRFYAAHDPYTHPTLPRSAIWIELKSKLILRSFLMNKVYNYIYFCFCRRTPACSAWWSTRTRSYQFTRKKSWRGIRALKDTKCLLTYLP